MVEIKIEKDYFNTALKQANKIHKYMKDNGFYVKTATIKGIGDIRLPKTYPNIVLAAINQLTASKIEPGVQAELMTELLMRINGKNPDGIYLDAEDLAILLLSEGLDDKGSGDVNPLEKVPPEKSQT